MLRHKQQTVATELSAALHHSRGVGPSPHAATYADAYTQTAPVAEYIAPAPDVLAAPAPVTECVALAPVLSAFLEPLVPVVQVVQVPQVQIIEKSSRFRKSSLLKAPNL